MLISLYTIFFSFWAFLNYNRYGFNVGVLIISLYLFGSINGFLIYLLYPTEVEFPERITFLSVASHIFLLWLFMYPLVHFGNHLKIRNLIIKERNFNRYLWLIIIPSILCILASGRDIFRVFAYGDFSAAREAYVSGDISSQYVTNFGIIGYVMCLGPIISFLALFFFCYKKFVLCKNNLTTILLFISSFGIVINNLTIAGREGFIRWILYCIVCYVFFKDYITFRRYKNLFWGIGIIATLAIAIFANITFARFETSTYGPYYSLMSYSGQQFYYYSYGFDRFANEGYGSLANLFPIITNKRLDTFNINEFVSADFYLNTFSTFVGSFIKEGGFWNTLALALGSFIFLIISFCLKKSNFKYHLCILVAYLFYYEIIMVGFFYFIHYLKFTQIAIVFYIIMGFFIGNTKLQGSVNVNRLNKI